MIRHWQVVFLGLVWAISTHSAPAVFSKSNLVAWCIVPFDAKKRGPEERAQMLDRLGIRRLAYDYRAEHIPTFDTEVETMKRHGIEFTAWWSPGELNDEARGILAVIARHKITPQLWITGGGSPTKGAAEQRARVETEAKRVRPIAQAAARLGCKIGLYNHGNWFGEPENQIQIIEHLKRDGITNVGIVYNFHHGHEHIDRFAELFRRMEPWLLCVNLNGMVKDGDRQGRKILHLAEGDRELPMLRVLRNSRWFGPVGIIDHRPETDSEETLRNNLRGFEWLTRELDQPGSGGERPFRVAETAPAREQGKEAPVTSLSAPTDPKYWAVEDTAAREKLPLYKTIPAAVADKLTPANGFPKRQTFRAWHRSHGDASGARYSALDQINRQNVKDLQVAWTYHSKDGVGNIQCNPVIANGTMFAPTVGEHVVAIELSTGKELWRFKPGGRPAHRGLVYSDAGTNGARLIFTAGAFLHLLDPITGKPIEKFRMPGNATAGPAVFKDVIIVPGFDRDVWGFDLLSGKLLWTFHTIPQPGEFGFETWDRPGSGANCWGGMALDEQRGIAYVTTGSPKPNFSGVDHRGDNLFANCLVALDARTGQRLWHFQEIRHDIWDLDLPAPPNLVAVTREGRRVDAVAVVTKIGNTLLLDRTTGEPLFPFRLRRAPVSKLPGETTSAYQPFPELPEPFARQTFSLEDVTNRDIDAREHVLARIASANFGWFEAFEEGKPTALYGIHGGAEWTGAAFDPDTGCLYVSANEVPWIISVFRNDEPPRDPKQPPTAGEKIYLQNCASCHGVDRIGVGMAPPLVGLRHRLQDAHVRTLLKTGRGLMPPSPPLTETDEKALLDFLFLRDRPQQTPPVKHPRPSYTHNGYPKLLDHQGYPGCKPPWGTLNCLDLNTGKLRWKVPLGEYPELTAQGINKTGTENFGGAIVTAGGLVFCAGTRDEMIRAFDKDTGAELWKHQLPFGGFAPPAIAEANGRQYLITPATGGGKLGTKMGDAYVAFALR
jgi:quinoprotein glucose dehydrogenase